jgi:hypothetical protein
MKLIFAFLTCLSLTSMAQTASVMEKKARELHRIIGLDDKAQWTKFIKENYTAALIAKPMNGKVSTNGSETSLADATKASSDIEAKANLLGRLHDDFGASKITSIKPDGDKLDMVLATDTGMTGTFSLRFDKNNLIDGFGVRAER